MQTTLLSTWPPNSSTDKVFGEKKVNFLQQKPRPKPKGGLPPLDTGKRKRIDSIETSPGNAPHVKKFKYEVIGAVQPSLVPARGADFAPGLEPTVAGAQSAERSSMGYFALNHQASVGGVRAMEGSTRRQENISVTPALQNAQPPSVVDASRSFAPSSASLVPQLKAATSKPPTAIVIKPVAMSGAISTVDHMRAVIEAQIDLEILHKHTELRYIEQEIAKCQIGLEQLRRVEVIPYPGSHSPSLSLSTGTGNALASPDGYTSPEFCAPWGVTDGPYARHYAKWLLSDAQFDPMVRQSTVSTPLTAKAGRASRASGGDPFLSAPPGRQSRVSGGSRSSLQGDASASTAQRDPMIMKRQQDDQWVRLRCNHCGRSNFNNIQGFLNHCRIAHKEDFKSHEAAAITCGEIVSSEESQFGADPVIVIRDSHVKAAVVATLPTDQALVSPLITNTPTHSPMDRVMTHPYTPDATPLPSPSNPVASVAPSSAMPHLSKLMARNGMSVASLESTAKESKKREDLSVYNNSDSERESHNSKHRKLKKPKSAVRHPSSGQYSLPTGSTLGSARPPSQKSSGRAAPSMGLSSYGPLHAHQPLSGYSAFSSHTSSATFDGLAESHTDGDVEMGLSPGTADSNPGLVSDHEDDDDDVDEDARSANGSHGGFSAVDVDIQDASDVEEGNGSKRVKIDGVSEELPCNSRREPAGLIGERSD
ncbi:hypothetical protein EJ08DRAFT_663850 [Tothia fuscella]|uniref:AHC1-like C2H2 zinc-finger domain-containing protein n=1 Tax=Tothia fuscella TaxID=1048955 RepID=A0A9P4NKJ2_9PEZI|nr:hypothetical protein EJ08DRAFT_663850 [Tothia fuscella]